MLKLIDHNSFYIHIPKTSGTNLKSIVSKYYSGKYFLFSKNFRDETSPVVSYFLEKYDNKDEQIIPKEFKSLSVFGWKTIFESVKKEFLLSQVQHASLSVWQKAKIYDDEKVITIVRNPYTKFISHYYASLYYLSQNLTFEPPSPTNFIKDPKLNFFIKMDPANYLTKQVDYLNDVNGNLKCDRFYKMETDLEILEKDYNLKNINTIKYNKSNYERSYKTLYNDQLIEFVREHYSLDFETFGYSKDPFW